MTTPMKPPRSLGDPPHDAPLPTGWALAGIAAMWWVVLYFQLMAALFAALAIYGGTRALAAGLQRRRPGLRHAEAWGLVLLVAALVGLGSVLVVTLGSLGSLAFERQRVTHQAPAFSVDAVDSVGAGDAFASGFCVGLCAHRPLDHALRVGNACGALVTSRLGVLDALPHSATVGAFLRSYS